MAWHGMASPQCAQDHSRFAPGNVLVPKPLHRPILLAENQTQEGSPSYINASAGWIVFNSDHVLESVQRRGELERSAMAKFSNSAVVLLMLLIAAWRTTPAMSHFRLGKPPAEPELDYGGRYVHQKIPINPYIIVM
jgi:hypothetical protein